MTYQEFHSLLEKKPDRDQEKVIRSVKNTIVSAGAGSGKTQTLASRFVYLLAGDLEDQNGKKIPNPTVERILTLTFTNKAAAEMYQRIYKTLKFFAGKTGNQESKKKLEKAIADFSKARIQTLDSYSASVLRQAAANYGIRPDFSQGEEPARIKDLAFDFVMKRRSSTAIQWISEPAKIDKCAALFAAAASDNASLADSYNEEKKCRVFRESLKKQKEGVRKIWAEKNGFLEKIEKVVKAIQDEFNGGKNEWVDKTQSALNFWNSQRIVEARKAFKDAMPKGDIFGDLEKLFDFAGSDECLSIQGALERFAFSNAINDEEMNDLIKNVLFGKDKKSAGLVPEFNGVLSFFSDAKYLEELHDLLDEFTDIANDCKRTSGQLTFKDVGELSLLALKENEELRKQERDSYDFIMIDEFQDNNAANRDALLLISTDDNGKVMENRLFFVGDEKQSIYKFRGADVSVFNSLEKFIQPCEKLPMRFNYRSNNILIDEFNQIFGGYLPGDGEEPSVKNPMAKIFKKQEEKPWRAKFDKDSIAIFPDTKKKEKNSGVKIQAALFNASGLDININLDEKDAKAFFVAQRILSLKNNGVKFEDIAVLSKSRTPFPNIARIFSKCGIPFSLDQQSGVWTQATANDFYNALRIAVYPADINAFAAFLTSPFCGMNVDDAQKILSLSPQKAFDEKIRGKEILDKTANKKYEEGQKFFCDFSRDALSKPISDSISRLWFLEGYRFSENADEEHYDLLFELARRADADGKDLSWFVDQLALEKDSFKKNESELNSKDVDFPVEKNDSVKVMTIHKSKGLEFDHVFVLGIVEPPRAGQDSSNIFKSEKFGAVVFNGKKSGNIFSLLAKNENDDKNDGEERRLAYVAITRAKENLVIAGSRPKERTIEGKYPVRDLIFSYQESEEQKNGAPSKRKKSLKKDNGKTLPDPPFEIEEIKQYTRQEARASFIKKSGNEKDAEDRTSLYKMSRLVPIIPAKNIWTSPSALEESAYDLESREEGQTLPASGAYPEINSFVNSSALKKNEYGTLFHAFMEDWARNFPEWTEDKVLAEDYFDKNPLLHKISLENKKILLKTFFRILEKFLAKSQNPAAAALTAGRPYKPEYKFKTKIASYVISGSMDALFQNDDGSWTVLDYKTDLEQKPECYYNQLACYKKTAADLMAEGDQSKIRCLLFYSESGEFVDISEQAQKALENLDDQKIFNLIEKEPIL